MRGEKFMPEMPLTQPAFTDSACCPFIKSKERIHKFKLTSYIQYVYGNELGNACFQHDMADGAYKVIPRRMTSDKVLRSKALANALAFAFRVGLHQ